MNHPIRIALVGAGYWGKNLARNFHQLGALGAIVDAAQSTQENMAKLYPDVRIMSAFTEALGDPKIQGIAIATPAETHANLAREAILAGKDVYVEKPLCLSEKEGEELIAFAEEHKRILMVGHLLWYHPMLLKLKELIKSGELGKIQYIYSNRLNIGKLRREENVLWSFAPHDVSVTLGLLDEMPTTVSSHGGNYLHYQVADVTVSLMEFASGVKAHVFVSWLHPFKEQKLVVVGDRKMAVFDDTAAWDKKLMLFGHEIRWENQIPTAVKADGEPVIVEQQEPLKAECAHFLDCMASRQSPRTDGQEGLRVLRVLNACQRALESGKRERLDNGPATSKDYFTHATVEIDQGVSIGKGSKIWHFSHILKNTSIGEGCNIGQNVVAGPNVKIGNNCKIQNNVSIYEGVTLEDHVFCGPSMVFTNVFNPRCEVRRMDELRQTLIKRGASMGANCTIVCGITVGEYAFIGAGAVVIRDVPAYAMMVGNPARQIGWMSRHGERLDLPLSGEGEATCPATGVKYLLKIGCCNIKDN
jgi:UDP-2-acetamido-3-amino-2,3-dideoxy-glucuronate N-acetyltransferase